MYGEFILTLLHSATNAHIHHFKTRSFAQHMALATFYEEIVDLTDTLTEAIQGLTGELVDFPQDYYAPADTALQEMMELKDFVKEGRKTLPDDSEIQNIVDEIADLINTTLYKLRFLS